ncbi:MAG: hypothetical protein FWB97_09335 [Oscillospiraceae bacterium]|nr:hypothetical protein [Oscillospiraceae bacterium]
MGHTLDFKAINEFSRTVIESINFTERSEDAFYDAVDLKEFRDDDAKTIFEFLKNKIRMIPFGDYLKRYIYLKAKMTGNYNEIDIREYQHIIIDSFAENNTPKSFAETSAKISALSKNWLTQAAVKRSVVFLLGFGLNMSAEDVSEFLLKALRERDFNFKDPVEVIYWHCFRNGYKFPKMLALMRRYDELEPMADYADYADRTIGVRDTIREIKDDESLLSYLSSFKGDKRKPSLSVTARLRFSELYLKCKSLIADYYNADESEQCDIDSKAAGTGKIWTSADIDEGDVEKVLCCGTPINKSGNLEKLSASKLSKYFSNKRFSRQHIAALLSESAAVDRFDLMTLNFFSFAQNKEYYMNSKGRYMAFADSTNEILNECMMGELYIANPYECFLLMCILSDSPLATYADVWEMSFGEQQAASSL